QQVSRYTEGCDQSCRDESRREGRGPAGYRPGCGHRVAGLTRLGPARLPGLPVALTWLPGFGLTRLPGLTPALARLTGLSLAGIAGLIPGVAQKVGNPLDTPQGRRGRVDHCGARTGPAEGRRSARHRWCAGDRELAGCGCG